MSLRVMWLLNHTSARKFEIPMLKSLGITEIFQPKIFPSHPGFRTASVDWSEDAHLRIPADDLAILNAANWYGGASPEAWRIADRYFDVCIFTLQYIEMLTDAAKYFSGALLWRVFGLEQPQSYSLVLDQLSRQRHAWSEVERLGERFFFAEAFDHLHRIEAELLQRRTVHLPLGMHDAQLQDGWQGADARIFFVCPDIGLNGYYAAIYDRFKLDFGDLPHAIGGAQPVAVDDPAVLGYTPLAVHEGNMRQMRAMFYHSTEPNHVHYHPFEAVRAGMPLVFMAGGMLDRLGGANLPGRCATVAQARAKLRRILDGDRALIDAIRASQSILLEPMRAENCRAAWREGFERIAAAVPARAERMADTAPAQPPRIAVILPIEYRGGTLRGAKMLAEAIFHGSRQAGTPAEVVFLHPEHDEATECFDDLHAGISRRPFAWRTLSKDEARRAMHYAGNRGWIPDAESYLVADDGIRQLQDCAAWLVVSDRLLAPLLPLRPCIHMVYDYIQRYIPVLAQGESDRPYIDVVRRATRVFVTTRFTQRDVLQYAGLPVANVVKLPILAPLSGTGEITPALHSSPGYFLWPTNLALHKNHRNALRALRHYYERMDGRLQCRVTGVDEADILASAVPHLAEAAAEVHACESLRENLCWSGYLPEREYRSALAGAAFLWHPARIDNGTFTAIEAAASGVAALSSDYPAMREIDDQFGLALAWMDADDPLAMAAQLKRMESEWRERRALLPPQQRLAEQGVAQLASAYWEAVAACL